MEKEQPEKIENYYREWSALNDYVNKIDLNYGNFVITLTAVVTVITSVFGTIISNNTSSIYSQFTFFIIPLGILAAFSYLSYQFRIVAILRGHLAYLEDRMNHEIGEPIYMWNSSLMEGFMAKNNVPNKTMMIPVGAFTVAVLALCAYVTFKFKIIPSWWLWIYWIVIAALSLLVFIPFFTNETKRAQTYESKEIQTDYYVTTGREERLTETTEDSA